MNDFPFPTNNAQYKKFLRAMAAMLVVLCATLIVISIKMNLPFREWAIALVPLIGIPVILVLTMRRNIITVKRWRPYGWVMLFILTLLSLAAAVEAWNMTGNDTRLGSWWTWGVFAAIMLVLDRLTTKSWLGGMQDGELKPRDEREQHILHRASEQSLTLAVLLVFFFGTFLAFAPMPSRQALLDLSFAIGFFLLGWRSFQSWRMGY